MSSTQAVGRTRGRASPSTVTDDPAVVRWSAVRALLDGFAALRRIDTCVRLLASAKTADDARAVAADMADADVQTATHAVRALLSSHGVALAALGIAESTIAQADPSTPFVWLIACASGSEYLRDQIARVRDEGTRALARHVSSLMTNGGVGGRIAYLNPSALLAACENARRAKRTHLAICIGSSLGAGHDAPTTIYVEASRLRATIERAEHLTTPRRTLPEVTLVAPTHRPHGEWMLIVRWSARGYARLWSDRSLNQRGRDGALALAIDLPTRSVAA
jgi:hypothetical protein